MQKAFCGKIFANKQGISMGHKKADSTVCDSGFALLYVYNADEMQQQTRPTERIFYVLYMVQQRAIQDLTAHIDFRIAKPNPISNSYSIPKVKVRKTAKRVGSVTSNACSQAD